MNLVKTILRYKLLVIALLITYCVGYFACLAIVKKQKNDLYDNYISANEFTANKIKTNLEQQNTDINRALNVFTNIHVDLIKELFDQPDDELLNEEIESKLKVFFGDYFSFTLADSKGDIIVESFDGLVGNICRIEIKAFSKKHQQVISFHRNPLAHHVDFMVELKEDGADGILFVSFYPEKIASLLKQTDKAEQEALLMNKKRPYLVDFDIKTHRNNKNYKRFIQPEDLNTTVVFVDIKGTNWNLFVKTNNHVLNGNIATIENNTQTILLLIMFLLSIIYFVINKQMFLKLDGEIKLRKHYQNHYFESGVITLVINAQNTKIDEVNKAAIKFYGFNEKELVGKKLTDLSTSSGGIDAVKIDDLNAQNIHYFACRQVLKNGKEVELEVHFSYFEEGNKSYYLLLAHEVSDKIYYQKQLKKKTTLLESIAFALPDMAFVINKHGTYLDVLEGNQFTKQQVKSIIGLNMTDIFNADLSRRAMRVIKKALKTNEIQYVEYQTDVMSNTMCWYEGRVMPISSSEDYADSVLWLARDIQDKKIKEQELTLAAMLFNTSDPVVIGNKEGEIIKVNPAFINVLGYSEEQLVGQNLSIFRSDKEKALDVYDDINSGMHVSGDWSGVTLNVCADGRELSMLETVTTIYDANNNVDKIAAQFKDLSEMQTLQLLVDESEARFKAIVESINEIVIVITAKGITYVSPSSVKSSGYTKDELIQMDLKELIFKDDLEYVLQCFSTCLKNENSIIEIAPFRAKANNNKWHWVKGAVSNLKEVKGIHGLVLSLEDVTEIIEVEDAFKKEVRKFKAIIEKGNDLVVVFNKERLITYSSPSVQKCLGYTPEKILGMNSTELLHEEDLISVKGNFGYLLAHPNEEILLPDVRVKHNDGHYILMEGVVTSIMEKNSVDAIVFNARDVTEKRKTEQKIEYQAFYDPLTNLPNRQFLLEYLSKVVATAKRHEHYGVVAFLDLDHFKYVNDSLGHDIGDKLLKKVANRIATLIRKEDLFSRLGGDEFVIVLQELGDNEVDVIKKADRFCNKILKLMGQKFIIDKHELYITPSIGLKLFSANDYDNVNELLKHADGAMYHAKDLGRNQFVYYNDSIQEKAVQRLSIENDLREAIKLKQLILHFQPQYSKLGNIVGAEALIRWQHPTKGLLYPADFIAVAEETGLIIEIGQWVIANALFNLQACLDAKVINDTFTLSINISTKQFVAKGFVGNFVAQLNGYPQLKNMLKVEITETLLLDNLSLASEIMLQLIEHGVQFSLDDFGTGYSSLQYLTRLPIKQLKIDRSFVSKMGKDSRDAAIVEMIISMATLLKLSVVAEGVETEEQLAYLNKHENIIIQGYYYSKPLNVDDFLLELAKK